MTPSAEGVVLEGVEKRYGRRRVLNRVSLRLAPGTATLLLGANGAGKTTLLRILATLEPPTSGTARLAGFDVREEGAAARARLGFVGHEPALYDGLTAAENLEFVARFHVGSATEARTRAERALRAFGLEDRRHESARRLSRGLKQRLAVARALLHDPPVLLLDEPFTGLDDASARVLVDALAGWMRPDRTLLLSTHDPGRVRSLATRVLVLEGGRVARDETAASGAERGA